MINIIRKNQQTLMIVVTILVIVSFIAFYNGTRNTNRAEAGPDKIATIYNHSFTRTDFDRSARKYVVARQIGLYELVQFLGLGNTQNEQVSNFIINLVILQHEAEALQINPTALEVQAEEKRLLEKNPDFQTDGKFDPKKLGYFVEQGLPSLGLNSLVVDELVTYSLQLQKLKALIGSSTDVTTSEYRNAAIQLYQKTELSVIRFNIIDSLASITVSDDEVKKIYDQRKEGLKSEEARKVKVVTFALSEAESALKDSNRIDALQKLGNKVNDFFQTVSSKDAKFDEVAAKLQLPVIATAEFTQSAPDPKIAKLHGVTEAAFKLTADKPSEAVEDGNTFYIVHLEGVTPSQQLSLDEAKPKIIALIKSEQAREKINSKAAAARTALEASLKAGKSSAEAVAALNLTIEKLPAFTLADFQKDSPVEAQQFAAKSMEMSVGQISELIPTELGGSLILVESRVVPDDAKLAEVQSKVSAQILTQKKAFAFLEWLRLRRDAAKIKFAAR